MDTGDLPWRCGGLGVGGGGGREEKEQCEIL